MKPDSSFKGGQQLIFIFTYSGEWLIHKVSFFFFSLFFSPFFRYESLDPGQTHQSPPVTGHWMAGLFPSGNETGPPKAAVLGSHQASLIYGFGRRADWKTPGMQTAPDNILPRGFRDIYVPLLWQGWYTCWDFNRDLTGLAASVLVFRINSKKRGKKELKPRFCEAGPNDGRHVVFLPAETKHHTRIHLFESSSSSRRLPHTHWSSAVYTRWPCCVTVQQSPWRCAWNSSSDRLKLSGSPQVWSKKKKKKR